MVRRLIATLAAAVLCGTTSTRAAEIPPLMLGSAWYPEQWPEKDWERDLDLMKEAG